MECAGVQLNSVVLALASLAGSGVRGSTVKQRCVVLASLAGSGVRGSTVKQRCVGPSEPGWEWSAREYS